MKASLNDKVAVLKNHPDTDTPYIVMTGTLDAVDKGLRTEDKRAWAEEGEVTDDTMVSAPLWVVVRGEDGRRFSYSAKSVKLFTQKLVEKHEATLALAAKVTAERSTQDKEVQSVFAKCSELGLDASTLSEKNARRILELLGETVHPLAGVAPVAASSVATTESAAQAS